jgi:tRNA-dihydrouridine synthase C
LKQWLNYLRRHYPEAQQAFDTLRLVQDPKVLEAWISQPLAKFERQPQVEALSN